MVQYSHLVLACLLGSAVASNKQISTDGTLACGILPSGNKDKVSDLGDELAGKQSGKSWTIDPGECNRVHCDDTTGIYVCNDGGHSITVTGGQIAKSVKCIYRLCCRDDFSGLSQNYGQSGQRFIRGMGMNFNIAVAYGRCQDPINIRPSNAGGWEVNGVCKGGVLIPDLVDCS